TITPHSSKKEAALNLLISLALVVICAGLGALVWAAKGKVEGRLTDYVVPVLMIGTSIGGIILGKNKKLCSVLENESMGKFFLALFSFSIASLINFDSIKLISKDIFIVFCIITVATFFLHMLLCKIFKIDIRIMIVTATAGIYGPAFIPGVCSALNDEKLTRAGLIMGSLGYIIGTFLGCVLTVLLRGGF
ncbi:MAG: DUF819 family protein, partial [Bacillota bacterium]|nr:DUF819 family protein [Bacillota bacterium]